MALGAGGLLGGLALLIVALKQVGLVGGSAANAPSVALPAAAPPAVVKAPARAESAAAIPVAAAPQGTGALKAPDSAAHTNLLDPEEGGTLVIASEDNWRRVMGRRYGSTIIGSHGFAYSPSGMRNPR